MNVFMITAEASQVMLIVLGYFLVADLRIDNEREKAGTRRLNNGGELSFMTMALHLSTVRQRLIRQSPKALQSFKGFLKGNAAICTFKFTFFVSLPVYSFSAFYLKNEHTNFNNFHQKLKNHTSYV